MQTPAGAEEPGCSEKCNKWKSNKSDTRHEIRIENWENGIAKPYWAKYRTHAHIIQS